MGNVSHGFETSAVALPKQWGYDVSRGYNSSFRWEGTEAQIRALELTARSNGWSTVVTEGALWTLTATIASDGAGGGETPTDIWELDGTDAEKDVLASNSPAITGLVASKMVFLRDVMDGRFDTRGWDCHDTDHTPSDIVGDSNAIQLYLCIAAGTKHKAISVPTLRHTQTASRTYQFDRAVDGFGELFSRSAVLTRESIPVGVSNQMFSDPGTNPYTRSDGVVVFAGWRKKFPRVQVSAYSKSQIIVEWEYGEWATIIYPTYNT